jgi:hypothetical protein
MVLIDFGGTTTERAAPPTDDPVRYWNNVTGAIGQSDAGQLSSLVTTQNLVTSIGLSMISRFNGVNDNGTLSNPAYPTDATRDSLFGNTETFSGLSNIFPAFKLTGLNPSRSYGLTFYASRTGVSDNRETLYLITGAATNTATLNAANNVTNRAVVSGVRPSALGEIAINLMPGPNNNNGMHFTYLGILALTPESGEIRFLAPSLNADQIILQWTGSGELQQAPTVTGPWSTVTPSGVNSHSETVDFETNRFFRIVAP